MIPYGHYKLRETFIKFLLDLLTNTTSLNFKAYDYKGEAYLNTRFFHSIFGEFVLIIVGRVGSKGELFPPKEIREKLGLKPGVKVVYRVINGKLIVEPIPSIEDVLEESKPVKISIEEFYRFRRKLSRNIET